MIDELVRPRRDSTQRRFLPGDGYDEKVRGKYRKALRQMVEDAVSEEDWVEIIKTIAAMAKAGDLHAARFLAEYRDGKPTERVDSIGSLGAQLRDLRLLMTSELPPALSAPIIDAEVRELDDASTPASKAGVVAAAG